MKKKFRALSRMPVGMSSWKGVSEASLRKWLFSWDLKTEKKIAKQRAWEEDVPGRVKKLLYGLCQGKNGKVRAERRPSFKKMIWLLQFYCLRVMRWRLMDRKMWKKKSCEMWKEWGEGDDKGLETWEGAEHVRPMNSDLYSKAVGSCEVFLSNEWMMRSYRYFEKITSGCSVESKFLWGKSGFRETI